MIQLLMTIPLDAGSCGKYNGITNNGTAAQQ